MSGKDFFDQAKIEFMKGRPRESITMFDKALEDNYEPIQTLLSRGAAYLSIHEFHNALGDFNQILAQDENNERAYYYRGITRMNLGITPARPRIWITPCSSTPNAGPPIWPEPLPGQSWAWRMPRPRISNRPWPIPMWK